MEVGPRHAATPAGTTPPAAPQPSGPPRLEAARPGGKAAQFAAPGGGATFFLALQGGADAACGLQAGDLLAVSAGADAEPGDLVVWWCGAPGSEALARVAADLSLRPVAGFPPPPARRRGAGPALRGVVVGRLRRQEE